MAARSYVISLLATFLLAPHSLTEAQQQPQSDFGRLLSETLMHAWRWSAYWNSPESLRGYIPGRQARVVVVRSGDEAMACIPELGQAWEMLAPEVDRIHYISWESFPADHGCEGKVSRFRQRTWPLIDVEQLARMKEKAGISPQEAREPPVPTHHLSPERSFLEAEYTWTLPELLPPEWPADIGDEDLNDVKEAVLQEALKRWKSECGPGEALVPRFSPRDRGVFVYTDLGRTCEKGVVDIMRDPDGRLTLGRFTTHEYNLDWLIPRIRNILLERIPIGH